jgi:predicted HicB family RNase H-like nuclease
MVFTLPAGFLRKLSPSDLEFLGATHWEEAYHQTRAEGQPRNIGKNRAIEMPYLMCAQESFDSDEGPTYEIEKFYTEVLGFSLKDRDESWIVTAGERLNAEIRSELADSAEPEWRDDPASVGDSYASIWRIFVAESTVMRLLRRRCPPLHAQWESDDSFNLVQYFMDDLKQIKEQCEAAGIEGVDGPVLFDLATANWLMRPVREAKYRELAEEPSGSRSPLNLRLSKKGHSILKECSEQDGVSMTAVVELSLRHFWRVRGQ